MAYITKEETAEIRNNLKKAYPEIKFSVRMRHHSTVLVTILESPYNFELNGKEYRNVNQYHLNTQGNEPTVDYDGNIIKPHTHLDILNGILAIISANHWDKSDLMTDYHHCAFYYYLSIGEWEKSYKLKADQVAA
jgi:hypothetical protein